MRKFLIPILMASAMIPAAASARDRDGSAERGQGRSEQSERSSDEKPQRQQERAVRIERRDNGGGQNVQRVERANRVRQVEVQAPAQAQLQVQAPVRARQVQAPAQTRQVRVVRRSNDGLVDGIRNAGRQEAERSRDTTRDHHDGSGQWQNRDGSGQWHDRNGHNDRDGNHRWSGNWRNDHRYDWHNYRDHNRSIFRLGSYYDPYSYGYRRFSIGFNLWPSYYGSNYWLQDPWMYRLPPAYGPYRWVRYYDDALLVNIYTGEVVDVLNNFFW